MITMTNLTGLFLNNLHPDDENSVKRALELCEKEVIELIEDGLDTSLASAPFSTVTEELIAFHDCVMGYEIPYPPTLHNLMSTALAARGRSVYITDPWF